jgi:hypothetical protein
MGSSHRYVARYHFIVSILVILAQLLLFLPFSSTPTQASPSPDNPSLSITLQSGGQINGTPVSTSNQTAPTNNVTSPPPPIHTVITTSNRTAPAQTAPPASNQTAPAPAANFTAPLPVEKVTVPVSPDQDAELKTTTGNITVQIPKGAVTQPVQVELSLYPAIASTGMRMVRQFDLNASSNSTGNVTQFSQNIKITIQHSPGELNGLVLMIARPGCSQLLQTISPSLASKLPRQWPSREG